MGSFLSRPSGNSIWGSRRYYLGPHEVPNLKDLATFYNVSAESIARRNDLLKRFVEHFSRCSVVREIQVVWSDQQNEPPAMSMFSLPQRGSGRDHVARIVFERHSAETAGSPFRPNCTMNEGITRKKRVSS